MTDYKKMYLRMLSASEKALNIIIEAQRECEEIYIINHASEHKVVSFLPENNKLIEKK